MSIPKEPRQLMINLMYLVLTALLALNVSAEVMNAFLSIDKSLATTNSNTTKSLDATVDGLNNLLKEDAKAKYRPLQPAIEAIRTEVAGFAEYVDGLRTKLIDGSGDNNGVVDDGDYVIKEEKRYKLKGLKNKDITTRLMVNEGIGDELEGKITQTRNNILKAYNDVLTEHGKTFGLQEEEIKKKIEGFAANLTLSATEEWKGTKKTSWSDFKFRQMPVAAVLPTLTQIVTDAKNAESAGVNQLAELSGGRVVEFNQFFPVVSAKKGYVIKGEKFEAEISVGTYSDQINPADVTITIDGQGKRPNKDGKVVYSTTANSLGKKTLKLTAAVRNPLTGETSRGSSEFSYEVGERSVAVSADKMNVFYIGVDNPISVSAAGVNSNDLKVSLSGGGGSLKKTGTNSWMAVVSNPGECKVNVKAGPLSDSKTFRIKRIPDPTARLGKKEDGSMGNGEFKAQQGLIAWLDNFDFDAKCRIQGFTMVRVPKREDPIESINPSGTFNSKSKRLTKAAKPGDTFFFRDVKARCPGDKAGRKINSLVFNIK